MDKLSRAEELRIIGVGDMLQNIADGLGPAHRRLWKTSRTPIGTLAIKDVEIKIDFEMSSNGSRQNYDASLPNPILTLGAKTFSFGIASEDSKQSNRATLTLKIVNVMPDKEDAELLRLLLLGVTTGISQLRLSKEQQNQAAEAIASVTHLIRAGELVEARAALDALIAFYEQLNAPLNFDGVTISTITPKP